MGKREEKRKNNNESKRIRVCIGRRRQGGRPKKGVEAEKGVKRF